MLTNICLYLYLQCQINTLSLQCDVSVGFSGKSHKFTYASSILVIATTRRVAKSQPLINTGELRNTNSPLIRISSRCNPAPRDPLEAGENKPTSKSESDTLPLLNRSPLNCGLPAFTPCLKLFFNTFPQSINNFKFA